MAPKKTDLPSPDDSINVVVTEVPKGSIATHIRGAEQKSGNNSRSSTHFPVQLHACLLTKKHHSPTETAAEL